MPNVNKNLSKQMLENIKNYSGEIQTLKDFVTAVRTRPGMYIGEIGSKGFLTMIREILQNSFDEMMKKSSPCDRVKISYDERTLAVSVEDNGRGIPFDNIIRIFENQHTSSNFTKKKGEYSSGLHGVGAKATNALSKKFIVESYVLGEARRVEFDDGYPWDKGEVPIPNPENKQGTIITFIPSLEAMGEIHVSSADVLQLLYLIIPLTDIGSRVDYSFTTLKGKTQSATIINEDGILSYLYQDVEKPLIKPICVRHDTGVMKMDVAFTYDVNNIVLDANIRAFGNCCPTSAGYHIDGFKKGLCQYFTNYMNKVFLAGATKKSKLTITQNDVRMGLKAVVSVAHLDPIFNGQAKEILSNVEMGPFVKDELMKGLDEWAKQNPSDLQKLCNFFKEMAQMRLAQDKERVRINNKYNSSLTGLPDKYVAPKGKKNLELFICEGDSAAGGMRNHRLNETQGYFPIRGKIPNAFNTSKKAFLENAEISGIIAIIGGGYGKDFDINKVKWSKIIIATDADADGDHISALLLRFFILYMPGLIENGLVFKAVAPLYGIKKGNNLTFLTDRMEYTQYLQKIFTKKYEVSTIDGKKLSNNELFRLLFRNADYAYELEKVSNGFSFDPFLLESVLLVKDLPQKEMQKKLKKAFRFIDVKNKNGILIIDGIYNSKYQTLFLDQRLIDACKQVFDIMNKNVDFAYKVNGEVYSLYQLISLFNKLTPPSLVRFKGLGEMNPEDLFESTLNPEKRTLIRYNVDDVKKSIEEIRYYDTDMEMLYKDVKVTRFDILS